MKAMFVALAVSFLSFQGLAYGPGGHRLVGAIAEQLLEGTPAASKLRALLGELTLDEAALIPDEIKGWDSVHPQEPDAFRLPDFAALEGQLIAFWEANSEPGATGQALHREFHFTDVPVKNPRRYSEGETGRSSVDLVHMVEFCIGVLNKSVSEENDYKITRPVAAILLAHYLGDIHQPLHVGAEYFSTKGKLADPDAGETSLPDEGGNTLKLKSIRGVNVGSGKYARKLHGFWDSEAVNHGLKKLRTETIRPGGGRVRSEEVINYFATHEPNWKIDPAIQPEKWAEAWADQILPLAREAHERLRFTAIKPVLSHGKTVASGFVSERMDAPEPYLDWAGMQVVEQIAKAGWRLAEIFKTVLK